MSNTLILSVYSSGTTQVNEPELANAEGLTFSTLYPGGRYGVLSCFIPRDVTRALLIRVGYRIVARNGLTVVWEGKITGLAYSVGGNGQQGITLTAAGQWGQVLEQWTINKVWSDQRIDEARWVYQTATTGGGDQKCDIDRVSRLRFTPKGVAWGSGNVAAIRYTAPTGQTIKRLLYTYTLAEGAQAWELVVYNVGLAADIAATSIVASAGPTAVDHTLATPSQAVEFRFVSKAAQSPTEDGTYFANFTGIDARTVTTAVEVDTIATDLITFCTDLNTSTAFVSVPGSPLSLVPFISNEQESIASILLRACAFGDTTFAAWAAYLRESDYAPTPNGNPVLVVEAQPVLTDYDYAVSLVDENLVPPLSIVKDLDGVKNWIVVNYTDLLDNRTVVLTPDDQSTLTDSTSVTAYGRRAMIVSAGQCTSTTALNIGRRVLASKKDAKFYASGPIVVKGYIRSKAGAPVPAANIVAGKRIKIENFLTDQVGVTGAGLTFIISKTDYNDDAQTCAITCGLPDDLSVFIAQLSAGIIV